MGGAGRDVLMGQAGVDFFKGGFGDDTFVFIIEAPGNVPTVDSGVGEGNRDVIEDFRPGRETIDLSSYARYLGPYQTSDAPVFLGKAAFTDSDVLQVRYDVQEDGDAVVQFLGPRPIGIGRERLLGEIELKNVGELTVENFLLGPAASDAPLGLEGDGRRGLRPDGGGSPSLRLSSVRLCAREPGGSRRGGYGAPFAPVATSQPMRPCRSCCSWSCGSLPRMEDAAEGMDRSQGSFRHSLRGPLCIT